MPQNTISAQLPSSKTTTIRLFTKQFFFDTKIESTSPIDFIVTSRSNKKTTLKKWQQIWSLLTEAFTNISHWYSRNLGNIKRNIHTDIRIGMSFINGCIFSQTYFKLMRQMIVLFIRPINNEITQMINLQKNICNIRKKYYLNKIRCQKQFARWTYLQQRWRLYIVFQQTNLLDQK